MAEAEIVRGGVSTGREPWKMCNSFAGYSLICARTKHKKVVDALQYEFNCRHPNVNTKHWTAFSGFVFVRPESSMTVNAFDSWRWRNGLRHLDLILHKSADTATEGLLSNLQAQNRNDGCKYFLPRSSDGASAGGIHSVASQPSVALVSADGASAGNATSGVGSAAYRPRTSRVEQLTPLLFGQDDVLVGRSKGYSSKEFLGGGSFGAVYKMRSPTGIDVAVKILDKHAWKDEKSKLLSMKEVFFLERCSDHDVHIIRVLDVFLDPTSRQLHIVLELWGESGEKYRHRKGFGRLDSQPTTHIRTLLEHLCRALSYLHNGLGLAHTDVKLQNILIVDKYGSLVNDIECKLADIGSAEEVAPLYFLSPAGN